jgi:hypothetical protein
MRRIGSRAVRWAVLAVAIAGGWGMAGPVPQAAAQGMATRPRGAPSVAPGALLYHGGPVMRTDKTYAIFWMPAGWTMVSGYRSLIDRYFVDASRASGTTGNVYAVLTQYRDTTGPIAYAQTWGGSTTTTTAFPAGGCPPYQGLRVCVSKAQMLAEIKRVIAAKGWTTGPTHAFFLFLPKGAGTCDTAAATACAFTSYCGYHAWSGTGATEVLFAILPYADTQPADCGTGDRPNGGDADETLNIVSHEHREMIDDPRGNAWYDASGEESSDKCAWTFGTALGHTATGAYNQVINGHDYWVQEEWSNAGSRCRQRAV